MPTSSIAQPPLIQRLRGRISRAMRPARATSGRAIGLRYLANPRLGRFVKKISKEGLTYLEPQAVLDLYDSARVLEQEHVDGIFLEAGCALGGSALTIAFAKEKARPLFVYDVFETIPPPSQRDGEDAHRRYHQIKSGRSRGLGGAKYYGYQQDLYQGVGKTFQRYGLELAQNNVRLVKGRFENTLDLFAPVAFAHIDCDWYDSVMTCLQRITPRLVEGGRLVIDDYQHWSGCKRAVDDYFRESLDHFSFEQRSRLHIVRKR
jgi:Macrocin-O-methyltransferase (TylF)